MRSQAAGPNHPEPGRDLRAAAPGQAVVTLADGARSPGPISGAAHSQKGGPTLKKGLSPAVVIVIILVVVIVVAAVGYFVFLRPKEGKAPEIPPVDTAPAGQGGTNPGPGNIAPPSGTVGG